MYYEYIYRHWYSSVLHICKQYCFVFSIVDMTQVLTSVLLLETQLLNSKGEASICIRLHILPNEVI